MLYGDPKQKSFTIAGSGNSAANATIDRVARNDRSLITRRPWCRKRGIEVSNPSLDNAWNLVLASVLVQDSGTPEQVVFSMNFLVRLTAPVLEWNKIGTDVKEYLL